MSSNTNIGNTPVNQGYVQLIHTGETGGIDGTLRTLYDGDGTASDLQIASNKVKVSTELYIGSKTATEFIQDIVGDMFTTGSYTNITTTYDDTNGNIDLSASGEVTLTGTQTLTNKTLASPTFTGTANGANLTLTGDLTVSGDTIFTNSNTVLIGDAILTLNADETGSPTANAGFEVERGTSTNKTFIWNETDDKWTIGSETFVASTVEANLTGNVTGNVTGSASLNLLKSSNLSDLANVATARTNLGVDVAGTDNSTDVTLVTTSHDYLSLAGQAITLGTIDISDDTNLVGGTGITLTGDTLSTTDSEIVHDNLSGFVSNEHIDHSGVSISAGSGLTGGGNITATRTLSVDVNNLDAQVPALELADKIAIYDNSATETNVATLTQLKAIVNTDTDTNQLTTFNVSGDSGTDQTISHNNTLTISGGNGISTSTSATDILSVALGGFSTLIAQSSPAEQDLLVIEEAIGGAIKKVQVGALSSGITIDGTTANGILTYGGVDNIDTESNLTFDGTNLDLPDSKKVRFGTDNDFEFYHDDTNAVINNTKGDLQIYNNADDKGIVLLSDDGSGGTTAYITLRGDLLKNVLHQDTILPATKKLYLDGGVDTYIFEESADNVIHYVGGQNKLRFNSTGTILNDAGLALDFRVEGDTDANLLFVDGSADKVGIGTISPSAKLEVNSSDGTETLRLHKSDTNIVENEIIGEILFTTADSTLASDRLVIGAIKCFAEENYAGANSNEGSLQFFTTNATDLRHSAAPTPRMVIDEDGNVGIGTASPLDLLHIKSSSTDARMVLDGHTGYDAELKFYEAGSSKYTIGHDSASGNFVIGTANVDTNQRLVINSSGNVGIGTNNPEVELHVVDSIYSQIRVETSGVGNVEIETQANDNSDEAFFGTRSNHALKFRTNWTNAMTIDTSQNVGIGTTSPSAYLHTEGASNGTESYAKFSTGSAGGDQILTVKSSSSRDHMALQVNTGAGATDDLALNPDGGNVGIGTTSNINERLNVYHSSSADVLGIVGVGSAASTNFANINFRNLYSSATGDSAIIGCDTGSTTDKGELVFSTSGGSMNATEKMRITSGGNVGIGAQSPNMKLNISHGDQDGLRFNCTSTTGEAFIDFGDSGDNDAGSLRYDHNDNSMKFRVNASERMRINSSGNVGIGDDNPPNKLSVKGSSTDLLYLEGDGITSTSIIASDTGGSLRTRSAGGTWQLYTGGSANSSSASGATFAMEVDSSQRVGIGTASPAQKLHVVGNGYFTADVVAYYSSDKRLKDNIKTIENAVDKVSKIRGVEFDWNDKQDTYQGHDIGVVAQEVEKVLPEITTTRDDGYKAVKYEKIVPLLIEAIKEQQKQIEELKNG